MIKFAIDFLEIWSFSFLNFSIFCPARNLVVYLVGTAKPLRTYQRVVRLCRSLKRAYNVAVKAFAST